MNFINTLQIIDFENIFTFFFEKNAISFAK
jgi:hypothetical protein